MGEIPNRVTAGRSGATLLISLLLPLAVVAQTHHSEFGDHKGVHLSEQVCARALGWSLSTLLIVQDTTGRVTVWDTLARKPIHAQQASAFVVKPGFGTIAGVSREAFTCNQSGLFADAGDQYCSFVDMSCGVTAESATSAKVLGRVDNKLKAGGNWYTAILSCWER